MDRADGNAGRGCWRVHAAGPELGALAGACVDGVSCGNQLPGASAGGDAWFDFRGDCVGSSSAGGWAVFWARDRCGLIRVGGRADPAVVWLAVGQGNDGAWNAIRPACWLSGLAGAGDQDVDEFACALLPAGTGIDVEDADQGTEQVLGVEVGSEIAA